MAFTTALFRNITLKSTTSILLKNYTTKKMIETCTKCSPICSANYMKGLVNNTPNYITSMRYYSKPAKSEEGRRYSSESESDSDLETIGHRGESDFWRRKIRTFHAILDVNKDGVISFDDFRLLADRFINLGHLSEQHTKEFRHVLQDLWEKRWGAITPYNLVTVEQFLEDMHHILNDRCMVRRAHSFLPYIFRAVDKDHSGTITVDEFTLFFECLGLDEKDAILAFHAIDTNNDGKLTMKEFVKHGRDFFLTEDEENISKFFWGPLVDH